MATTNAPAHMPADTPVARLGKKMIALEEREWKGNPQLSLREVTPVVDGEDPTKVIGWVPVWGATNLSGDPDAVREFLSRLRSMAGGRDKKASA